MLNQSKGLWYLSLGQAVDVLGNGLLQSLLILYLTRSLHLQSHYAYALNAASISVMGFASLLCGYVAGRTSYVQALFLGGFLRVIAFSLFALGSLTALKWSFAFLAIGQGFSFTVYLVLLGQLYKPGDTRRYAGFTISYLLMNVSFIVSMAIGGYLVRYLGFGVTFLIGGACILGSLGIYYAGIQYIGSVRDGATALDPAVKPRDDIEINEPRDDIEINEPRDDVGINKLRDDVGRDSVIPRLDRGIQGRVGFLQNFLAVGYRRNKNALKQCRTLALFSLLGVPIAFLLFTSMRFTSDLSYFILVLVIGLWVYIALKRKVAAERIRLFVFLILGLLVVVWNGMYLLQTSLLTLFTANNVHRVIFSHVIPASSFGAVNAVYSVIITFGLVFLWHKLSQKNQRISIAVKFSFGLVMMGLGWLLLTPAIMHAQGHKVGVIWILLSYLPQVLAGSIIYPIGNAVVGSLSPPRMEGSLMATWQLLGQGVGAFLGGKLALLAAMPSTDIAPATTNPIYAKAFAMIGALGLSAALVCWLSRKLIARAMCSAHDVSLVESRCEVLESCPST